MQVDDDGDFEVVVDLVQIVYYFVCGGWIEVGYWFVGEDDVGFLCEGVGDCDMLLLVV